MQRNYELMVILPVKGDEFRTSFLEKLKGSLVNKGSENIQEKFLGKKRFFHAIDKSIEGEYFTLNFQADSQSILPLQQELRLNQDVLRYQFFNKN